VPDQLGLANEWYAQLAEPVRLRPPTYRLDLFNRNASWFGITTSAFLQDWYFPLAEPVRSLRPLPTGERLFNRNAEWFGIETSAFLRDWYRPLSEPVRSKPPLPRGAAPFFMQSLHFIDFRFSIVEQGDTGVLQFARLAAKNLARVGITEIPVGDMAHVSIEERRRGSP